MIVRGNCITFSSTDEYFGIERDGSKPCTEQVVTNEDSEEFIQWSHADDKKITIVSTKTGEWFDREIAKIVRIGELAGQQIYCITWKHPTEDELDTSIMLDKIDKMIEQLRDMRKLIVEYQER